MSFKLGTKSRAELAGVHPRLVGVVERAIATTLQDFTVHDGIRTEAEQRALVGRGASRTMDSKHIRQSSGFGHAVDLVPYIGGKLRWEWEPIYPIAAAMANAAREAGVTLTWGGVWDRRLGTYGFTSTDMARAVNAYVDRRRALGKSAFIDGPHFELVL